MSVVGSAQSRLSLGAPPPLGRSPAQNVSFNIMDFAQHENGIAVTPQAAGAFGGASRRLLAGLSPWPRRAFAVAAWESVASTLGSWLVLSL